MFVLKSIYYKRRASWIFVLQESNTFVEIIEKKYVQALDSNLRPACKKSIMLTIKGGSFIQD